METIGLEFSDELLTSADEIELAKAIEAGVLAGAARRSGGFADATEQELTMLEQLGGQAARRFAVTNLRLVAMVSHRDAVRGRLPEDEVFQEGCLGLLEAIRRFDHRRGWKFATYALYWIRAYTHALTATRAGEVNLPVSRAARARRLHGTEAELSQRLGREASAAELAAVVGMPSAWVTEMLGYRSAWSLEEALDEVDVIDDAAEHDFETVLRAQIPGHEVLARLDALQRQVIEVRYGFADGEAHTVSDTARILGLSVSKARRTEERALSALRGVYPQQASVHL